MWHARRWKLSAAQRADMWNRWKAGQSFRRLVERWARTMWSFSFCWRVMGESLAHPGRTRRHLPRNRQRLFDAGHRPTCESRLLHGKPRGSPPWRARAVSSQPSRSAGLGVGRSKLAPHVSSLSRLLRRRFQSRAAFYSVASVRGRQDRPRRLAFEGLLRCGQDVSVAREPHIECRQYEYAHGQGGDQTAHNHDSKWPLRV